MIHPILRRAAVLGLVIQVCKPLPTPQPPPENLPFQDGRFENLLAVWGPWKCDHSLEKLVATVCPSVANAYVSKQPVPFGLVYVRDGQYCISDASGKARWGDDPLGLNPGEKPLLPEFIFDTDGRRMADLNVIGPYHPHSYPRVSSYDFDWAKTHPAVRRADGSLAPPELFFMLWGGGGFKRAPDAPCQVLSLHRESANLGSKVGLYYWDGAEWSLLTAYDPAGNPTDPGWTQRLR